ncbi:hypothetical protein M501DRAFT_1000580 [Patellaria atrata CBS 101060]|uniref:Putative phospholipase n=1 Tax=Patellaria atrata CBS 101060 TaxID=1346257 RepID=A0A9P4SEV8_9PEZI|nr:hypothetical protein M501DRAFT_1000580 [Patellaria atrata CBS 101060]
MSIHFLLLYSCFIQFVWGQLPPYTGQFGVGTIDIEVPINPRNISNYTFEETGEPVFLLETVLFSTYYPIDSDIESSHPQRPWIPRPLDLVAEGLSVYVNSSNSSISTDFLTTAIQSLAGSINISAIVDAPILDSAAPFPVLVFSHGDVALRAWYSQFCGDLASHGFVVAAVEHRDGSAAATQVRRSDGTTKNVTYLLPDTISSVTNVTDITLAQRDFRQAEVVEVIKVLQNITSGEGTAIRSANTRDEGETLDGWNGRLDLSTLLVGGHSFGAASALQTLSEAPNGTVPAQGAILLDPGKQSGPLNTDVHIPILMADSEEWSSIPFNFYGREHFDVLKDIAEDAPDETGGGWFMTLLGTAHTTITDPSFLGGQFSAFFANPEFNATLNSSDALAQYIRVSTEFFHLVKNGTKDGVLAAEVTHPNFNEANETAVDDTDQNITRYWEIHVAPDSSQSETNDTEPEDSPNDTDNEDEEGDAMRHVVQYVNILVMSLICIFINL